MFKWCTMLWKLWRPSQYKYRVQSRLSTISLKQHARGAASYSRCAQQHTRIYMGSHCQSIKMHHPVACGVPSRSSCTTYAQAAAPASRRIFALNRALH
jgi:hypothetical protein